MFNFICDNCGIDFIKNYKDYRTRHNFCCKSCAAKFNNKFRNTISREKQKASLDKTNYNKFVIKCCQFYNLLLSKIIIHNTNGSVSVIAFKQPSNIDTIIKKYRKDIKRCKICGCSKGHCIDHKVCSSNFVKIAKQRNLIKAFGFDISVIGTYKVVLEYKKLKDKLYDLYYTQGLSHQLICDKFNIPSTRSATLLFRWLQIPVRSEHDQHINALKHNRIKTYVGNTKLHYTHGWFETWDGNKVYLRSSYEVDYLKLLNDQKIKFDVESLRIEYFDTEQKQNRIAIPDFHLIESNTIVEIKSYFTYNKQNMNDRFAAYKSNGYNCKLVLEHQEYNYCPDIDYKHNIKELDVVKS